MVNLIEENDSCQKMDENRPKYTIIDLNRSENHNILVFNKIKTAFLLLFVMAERVAEVASQLLSMRVLKI